MTDKPQTATITAKQEALELLRKVANEADVYGGGFGHWIRDRVESAIHLVEELKDGE